jgi:putative transposase
MRGPYTQLFVHYVWATWDRGPLVTTDVEGEIYACIAAKCEELKCEPIAIGGIEDHVHLLVRLSAGVAIATLVGEVKGASSHLMTHRVKPDIFFKWQGAYGAFTLSKGGVTKVAEYVRGQKEHHAEGRVVPELERWEEG